MADKLWFLIPEMILFAGVVIVSIMGLAHNRRLRDALPLVTAIVLAVAMVVTPFIYAESQMGRESGLLMPRLGLYVKLLVCGIGILLAMLSVGLIDRKLEAAVESGRASFDALRANRGEYYAFFLLSLIGVMLCASARDLIWLFLALELTSLPTYIMVAMSRGSQRAQEAAVKYFFLGAMAAAMFLYGFALLYGATGSLVLTEIRESLVAMRTGDGELPMIAIVGLILAVLGMSFKIAAAPMHFYAADVYEGAASPVTAFIAFVPKTAGMLALIAILSTSGWTAAVPDLPQPIVVTLWMLSILTMTLGNVGALLQRSVKRMLAYSSIAHTGYMLIGVLAGPGLGINAVLFYLLAYGIMNTGAFAALAGLERRGYEIETLDDLAGLRQRHPAMAVVVAITAGSLIGFPPLLGFVGKLYLFIAGIQADHLPLVIIAGLNSAVSAWYYLRLAGMPILAKPTARSETIEASPSVWPRIAGVLSAVSLIVLVFFSQRLIDFTESIMEPIEPASAASPEESDQQRAVATAKTTD